MECGIKLEKAIKKELERKNLNANEFAKAINVTPGNLSKFLNKKAEVSFSTFLTMVCKLIPEKEVELMKKYASMCSKPENVRLSMEYACRHQLFPLLLDLIKRAKEMKNSETVEMAQVYEFYHEMFMGKFPDCFMKKHLKIQTKYDKSKLLTRLIFCYYLLQRREFGTLRELIRHLDEQIDEMQDGYLKDSFKTRVFEIYSHAHLKKYNLDKSREYAMKIINYRYSGGQVLGNAYEILGISYMFENAEKSLFYLNECIKTLKEHGFEHDVERVEKNRISIVKNYHGLLSDDCEIENPLEKAYFLITTGKNDEALVLMNEVPDNPLKDYLKGLCYSGMKGVEFLYQSMISFERQGDQFTSQLARQELVKRGHTWAKY